MARAKTQAKKTKWKWKMHTVVPSEMQRLSVENISDPVQSHLDELKAYTSWVDETGFLIPDHFVLGHHGPVTIIEDRNAVVKRARTGRFAPEGLDDAFGHARSVSILPYAPRSSRGRLGVRTQANWHGLVLCDRLMSGAAVVVLTTSDRLRFWLEETWKYCPREAIVEYYDATGVRQVSEGGL